MGHGESGSLVVNSQTWTIYGYVVARGISSQAYVTPMFDLLNQIENTLGGTVRIPDPILQLAKLELCYKDKNDDTHAQKCTELLQKSLSDDTSNSRALIAAVLENNGRAVDTLLNAGADVDVANPNDGCTALHIASRDGNLITTELLLKKGANHSVVSPEGHTPVEIARARGHSSIVEVFLRASETTVNVTSDTAKQKGFIPPQDISTTSSESETSGRSGEIDSAINNEEQISRNVQFQQIFEEWKSGASSPDRDQQTSEQLDALDVNRGRATPIMPVEQSPMSYLSDFAFNDSLIQSSRHRRSTRGYMPVTPRHNPLVANPLLESPDMLSPSVPDDVLPTWRRVSTFNQSISSNHLHHYNAPRTLLVDSHASQPEHEYSSGPSRQPPPMDITERGPPADRVPQLPLSVAMKWRDDKKKTPKAKLPHSWLLEKLRTRDHVSSPTLFFPFFSVAVSVITID